jgi:hypothetical protein
MFIEEILPLNSSELRQERHRLPVRYVAPDGARRIEGVVSYKHFAPSGAGGILRLPIQDDFSTQLHNLGDTPSCTKGDVLRDFTGCPAQDRL